jgi:hypothetical protein
MANREPVTIITSRKTYDNMVLQHFKVPVDVKTGYALQFDATLKQVNFVTNDRQLVRVAVPQVAAAPIKLGNVPSQPSPYEGSWLGGGGQEFGVFNTDITSDNMLGRQKLAPASLSALSGGNPPSQ